MTYSAATQQEWKNSLLNDNNILQNGTAHSAISVVRGTGTELRCPHCRTIGIFPSVLGQQVDFEKSIEVGTQKIGSVVHAYIRICPNSKCKGIVFTAECATAVKSYPPQVIDFDDKNIPKELSRTLKEAIVCHSNGAYRACAMMVRRLLEELCSEAGAEGKNLYSRLKTLRDKITLPNELFDAMDELKALGNDAAHIEAKSFDEIDEVEATLSIELAQEILKARFQHQDLVNRLRNRRKDKTSA